jgi:hypothetical protein
LGGEGGGAFGRFVQGDFKNKSFFWKQVHVGNEQKQKMRKIELFHKKSNAVFVDFFGIAFLGVSLHGSPKNTMSKKILKKSTAKAFYIQNYKEHK